MIWIQNSFSTVCLLLKRCSVNLFSLAELFQRFWNKISQKNIHKASQASHAKIFSIRCSCINTKQFLYFLNWYCFGTTYTKIDIHSDCRFAFLGNQYQGSKFWAGSSISSHITWYINLKVIFSIVFVCHIDVHIQQFSIYTKLSKTMAFEKSVLSIVAYGLYLTCVTSIAFTIHARHARGLFVMKCIKICSDMNI